MSNEKDIKIKEKSLEIKRKDLYDQVSNIDKENKKSGIIIGVIATFILFGLKKVEITSKYNYILLFILYFTPIIISLYNIYSKEIHYHMRFDKHFNNDDNKDYNKYLNRLYSEYNNAYEEASKLLEQKAKLTKITYISTIGLMMYIFIITLI